MKAENKKGAALGVLVVDDELRFCQILDLMLRNENYEVLTTTDSQQAVRMLDEQEFDLVISDMRMAQFSGIGTSSPPQRGGP